MYRAELSRWREARSFSLFLPDRPMVVDAIRLAPSACALCFSCEISCLFQSKDPRKERTSLSIKI